MNMNKLNVILSPEGETLWIRRPELLLLMDKVLIDSQDFTRIINRSARSQFDAKISALLEAYVNEGYVEVVDYRKTLSDKDKYNIYSISQNILNKMSFDDRKATGIYGHQQFVNYLGAKLEHLNADEPLFKRLAKARREVIKNINSLLLLDRHQHEYPLHVAEMQRRAIAKWLAAELLAHKFKTTFIFDLDEYRPYAKIIRENVLIDRSPVYTKTIFPNDQTVPFRIMWDVIKIQLPRLSFDSTDDLLRFAPTRKEFEVFRNILRDLVQYHEEVQDETILYRYANRRFKDAQDKVQELFNKAPRRFTRCLPSCLAYLLNKIWVPASSSAIGNHLNKSQAKDIFDKVKDAYQKLCCFSMYTSRKPIPEAIPSKKKHEDDKQHWVTGAPLSWYEKSAKM